MKEKTAFEKVLTLSFVAMLTWSIVAWNGNSYGVHNAGSGGNRLLGSRSTSGVNVDGLAPTNWSFDRARDWADFAYVDQDSAELVIGINNAWSGAYSELSRVVAMDKGRIVNTVSMGRGGSAVVVDMSFDLIRSFVNVIQTKGLATFVEPNMRFQTEMAPNDSYWNLQWGPQKIEADWAWNTTVGDSSVIVAVIDTGIDYNHPDLAANYVPLGYDWVNNDADPMDDFGHGTHVAGTIAAVLNNGVGIAGMAQVKIMAEKGLSASGGGYEDDLANAIIHAVNQGADILSNSWGGYGQSMLIYDAIKYAYDAGALIVAAAGNDATNLKAYPAAYNEVIAVTATNRSDDPAWFTNFGDWVELAAPGVDIYSTMPTYNVTLNKPPYNISLNYDYLSGTSMATPHVSGTAALIWSRFPNMTRDQVRVQLRYSADDLGVAGFDNIYGYGRINARKAVEQVPPDHDLLVFDYKTPLNLWVGRAANFDTTVLNFGTNPETNVQVQLLVNGSVVDSASITALASGAVATVGLSWTPSAAGTSTFASYVVPVAGETVTQNNIVSKVVSASTPTPLGPVWTRAARDPFEQNVPGMFDLAAIATRIENDILYFRVTHYRRWAAFTDILDGIFIDVDQNRDTGLPDGTYYGQNTGIGADYVIVAGWETAMYRWDSDLGWWDDANPIPLAYLNGADATTSFFVGVYFSDLQRPKSFDGAVMDMTFGDWMPDFGAFSVRTNHDVAVTNVTPLKTIVGQGYNFRVNATVTNYGLSSETFNVTLYAGSLGEQTTSTSLASGGSTTITFILNTAGAAYGNYSLSAYAWSVPYETDILDNTYNDGAVLVTIPGDVNGDRTVNILDVATVSAHWYPGPPIGPLGYDSNADINDDGAVNIVDASIISAHWGQSW